MRIRPLHVLTPLALVVLVSACKPSRADVAAMLEQRGFHAVEIDPADNELGVYHFRAKRSFEDCRGTFVVEQKILSSTCTVREQVSSPLESASSEAR